MAKTTQRGATKPTKCKKAELKAKAIALTAQAALHVSPRSNRMMVVLKQLKNMGAPTILMSMVMLIMCQPDLMHSQIIDWTEYFAGKKAVSRAMLMSGLVTLSFEKNDNNLTQDIMGVVGYIYAVHMALRVRPGGGTNTAPVCSTWTWVNRYTSKRSDWRPLGCKNVPSVVEANIMVSRQILLLWIYTARKIYWVLEQPLNSLMEKHPRFLELASRICITRTSINMGDFGATSKKPSWIYSSHPFITELKEYAGTYGRKRPQTQIVKRYTDKNGKKCVQGGAALKASQHYPEGFGMAMRDVFLKHRKELEAAAEAHAASVEHIKVVEKDMFVEGLRGKDRWSDANLSKVFGHLQRHI